MFISRFTCAVDTLYLVSDSGALLICLPHHCILMSNTALYYWRGDLKRADRVNVDPGVAPNSRVVLVGDRGLIIVTPHAADWYYCSSHNSCGRVSGFRLPVFDRRAVCRLAASGLNSVQSTAPLLEVRISLLLSSLVLLHVHSF